MNIKADTIQYFLKIITLVLGILLLFNIVNAIGYFVNERRNAHPSEIKVKVDTLLVYDTILVEKPVIKKVEIIGIISWLRNCSLIKLLPQPLTIHKFMFRRKFPRDNILLIYDRNFKWSNSIYVSI